MPANPLDELVAGVAARRTVRVVSREIDPVNFGSGVLEMVVGDGLSVVVVNDRGFLDLISATRRGRRLPRRSWLGLVRPPSRPKSLASWIVARS